MSTRSRRRRRQRRRRQDRTARLLLAGGIVALVAGPLLLGGAKAVDSVCDSVRAEGDIKEIRLGQNTVIRDNKQQVLGRVAGITNRTEVRLGRIPKTVRQAHVAVEDQRFYEHDGVDVVRVFGAAWRNARSGSAREGGSTITMQLAKNLDRGRRGPDLQPQDRRGLPGQRVRAPVLQGPDPREVSERRSSTATTPSASRPPRSPSSTSPRPSWSSTKGALLAGLPQAPTAYDPFANPGTATQRRNEVLDRMREQGYITREEARVAKAKPLGLERGRAYEIQREGYVFDYVREQLIDRYGEEEVQRGGFQVFTTIDPDLQEFARDAPSTTSSDLDDDPRRRS